MDNGVPNALQNNHDRGFVAIEDEEQNRVANYTNGHSWQFAQSERIDQRSSLPIPTYYAPPPDNDHQYSTISALTSEVGESVSGESYPYIAAKKLKVSDTRSLEIPLTPPGREGSIQPEDFFYQAQEQQGYFRNYKDQDIQSQPQTQQQPFHFEYPGEGWPSWYNPVPGNRQQEISQTEAGYHISQEAVPHAFPVEAPPFIPVNQNFVAPVSHSPLVADGVTFNTNVGDNSNSINRSRKQRSKPAGCSSAYRGVSWQKRDKKWVARIWVGGKTKHLGSYSSELEAAQVVDRHTLAEHGDAPGLQLNFPPSENEEDFNKQSHHNTMGGK